MPAGVIPVRDALKRYNSSPGIPFILMSAGRGVWL